MVVCSRQCCNDIQPILWTNIQIHENFLQSDVSNKLVHLRHTNNLKFMAKGYNSPRDSDYGDDCNDDYYDSDEEIPEDPLTDTKPSGYSVFSFTRIILAFSESHHTSLLKCTAFMVRDGLIFASETLTNLEELDLCSIDLSSKCWEALCLFRTLKRLRIANCNISDDDVNNVCASVSTLDDLELDVCGDITGLCLMNTPFATRLHRVAVTSMLYFPDNIYSMPKHSNILHVDFGYTRIGDGFLSTLST